MHESPNSKKNNKKQAEESICQDLKDLDSVFVFFSVFIDGLGKGEGEATEMWQSFLADLV